MSDLTREEAIQRFNGIIRSMSISVAQAKFYPTKAKLNELCDMAIEALSEPINCVKCKHYYETEDDTDVHEHCKMDTAMINYDDILRALEVIKFVCESTNDEGCKICPLRNDEGSGCMCFEVSPLCWDLVEHTNSWRAFK